VARAGSTRLGGAACGGGRRAGRAIRRRDADGARRREASRASSRRSSRRSSSSATVRSCSRSSPATAGPTSGRSPPRPAPRRCGSRKRTRLFGRRASRPGGVAPFPQREYRKRSSIHRFAHTIFVIGAGTPHHMASRHLRTSPPAGRGRSTSDCRVELGPPGGQTKGSAARCGRPRRSG